MNKIVLFLISIIFTFSYDLKARELPSDILHYDINDFVIDKKDDMVKVTTYSVSLMQDQLIDYNYPFLPVFVYGLGEINSNSLYDIEVEVINSEQKLIDEDIDIATLNPIDSEGRLLENKWIRCQNFDNCRINENVNICCEGGYVTLILSPFSYDEKNQKLYFTSDFQISKRITRIGKKNGNNSKITFTRKSGKIESLNQEGYGIEPLIGGVDFPPVSDAYYPESPHYVIITTEDLKDSFTPLLEWKTQKGLTTQLITVEEIYKNYTAQTQPEKIKKYLAEQYGQRLVYVLLGGSAQSVPTQKCFGEIHLTDGIKTDKTIPTDLYYSCMKEPLDWDRNGNKIYGEVSDSIELKPELAVTRIPLDSKAHIEAFIKKLLDYEKKGIISEEFKILLTGAEMHWKYNGLSDAELNANYIANQAMQSYDNGKGIVRKFDTSKPSYNINASFIANEMNNGYAFMDVQTHGEHEGWVFPYNNRFTQSTASKINNNGFTIVTSCACFVNSFDKSKSTSNPCLSQYLLSNKNSGVVAFYGASREGIGGSYEGAFGVTQQIEASFYTQLFNLPDDNKSFGKIVALGKKAKANQFNISNSFRWCLFGMNAIGDPEMPIYVTVPKKFDSVKITKYGTMIIVETGTPGCTICITGKKNGKDFKQVGRNIQKMNITSLPENPVLVITKQNYLPLILEGDFNIN